MDEQKIQEALKILHGKHALVSRICWIMEETYSMEDMEKIQKAISNTKCNILSFLFDRSYLIGLVEMLHEDSIRDNEDICKLEHELNSTQYFLKDT